MPLLLSEDSTTDGPRIDSLPVRAKITVRVAMACAASAFRLAAGSQCRTLRVHATGRQLRAGQESRRLVADAARARGLDVRRHYARALVDGGNPTGALRRQSELAAAETVRMVARVEAWGGIARSTS